jgi:hypothetical protein
VPGNRIKHIIKLQQAMSYKIKTIAFLILIIWLQACTVRKKVQSGVNAMTDRVVVVPTAVARFVTDASKKIYSDDSLKDGTSVVIDNFNVKFYNQNDSLQVQMSDMTFYWLKGSLYYKNFIFPKWDINKYADTMRSVFDCSYQIPGKTQVQCISGEYSVKNGKIEKIAEFRPCVQ